MPEPSPASVPATVPAAAVPDVASAAVASPPVSPPLVALATWLLPGAGYWLIGQRARALTVGTTVVTVFAMGLLIGGVRVLEAPGYDEDGLPIRLNAAGERIRPENEASYARGRWVLRARPTSELRAKPWTVPQLLAGPVVAAGWAASVWASRDPDGYLGPRLPPGVVSHARVNEIGLLYTAVAGMLNLLAIIDSAHRAGQAGAK
jgi:hypothetical protein